MGLINKGKGLFDKAKDTSANAYNSLAMSQDEINNYMTDDETAIAVISQYTPHNMKTLVLTNDRVLVFTKQLLKRTFEDYYFKDMRDAHFSSDLVKQGAITLTTDRDGEKKNIKINYLPTDEARAFYVKLQKIEKEWSSRKREIDLEDKRAASGASSIVVGPSLMPQPTQTMSLEEKLRKLKSMKEQGLIDEETFKAKSAKLLDEL